MSFPILHFSPRLAPSAVETEPRGGDLENYKLLSGVLARYGLRRGDVVRVRRDEKITPRAVTLITLSGVRCFARLSPVDCRRLRVRRLGGGAFTCHRDEVEVIGTVIGLRPVAD